MVEITQEPGKSFLDRMIALVEGAERRKTPNEIALNILLAGLTIVFLVAVVTLRPFAEFAHTDASVATLIALLVALIPTTIGALLSAIGIAGMDRLVRRNVLALSGPRGRGLGRRRRPAARQDRHDHARQPPGDRVRPDAGRRGAELAEAAQMASLADETPEGRSIVVLAKQYGIRERHFDPSATFVPFTRRDAHERRGPERQPACARARATRSSATSPPRAVRRRPSCRSSSTASAREGGTPLAVARDSQVLGVIYLKDVVKEGMSERFDHLRAMGIRTVMITGDNPLTAAKIAEESGVDDFLAEATPEAEDGADQARSRAGPLVAMTGDGTNDAPALAQSDVGVAMNTGTQAAREAGNMVDLDSNPTKLIEIVEVGKQLLITRGALTTFSIANDVAKYFAILPAIFAATYAAAGRHTGPLDKLNIMNLGTPESAIISAIVFNALLIPMLIPLALRGVRYRPIGATALLRRNILIYGARRPDHPVHRDQARGPDRPQPARRLSGGGTAEGHLSRPGPRARQWKDRGHYKIFLGMAAASARRTACSRRATPRRSAGATS